MSAVNEQRRICQALLTEQRNQTSFFVSALLPVLVSFFICIRLVCIKCSNVMLFVSLQNVCGLKTMSNGKTSPSATRLDGIVSNMLSMQ